MKALTVLPHMERALQDLQREDVKMGKKHFDFIVEAMEAGLPLTQVLSAPGMPSYRKLLQWLDKKTKSKTRYEEARRRQVQLWVDWSVELATAPLDNIPVPESLVQPGNEDKLERYMKAAVATELQRRKQLISTYQWLAGKWAKDIYGSASETAPKEVKDDMIIETVTFKPK